MKRWPFTGAALAALAFALPAQASTQGMLKAAVRTGQVSLFRIKDECLALTAGHVVGDAVQATVTIDQAKPYQATVLYRPPTVDLALLSVEATRGDRNCADGLDTSTTAQALTASGSQAIVLLAGGGLFDGAIISHDPSWVQLVMRPAQMSDPRIEEGISGALVTMNGSLLGIVTHIDIQGAEKHVILVSFDEVRRQFAEYLPGPGQTLHPAWDLSWWPQPARDAISASSDIGERAAKTANRAIERVNSARAIIGNAEAVPNDQSRIDQYRMYHYIDKATASEVRAQINTTSTKDGFSFLSHGLGESDDAATGRTFIGQWVNGRLILGETINEVTPQSPEGSDRIYGMWDEQGNLVEGDWYQTDGRQFIGTFKGKHLTRGRIIMADGSIFVGEWPKNSPDPEGPCVWWSTLGVYQQGGLCKGGQLVTPYRRP